jgi:hypothetical protein
VSVERPLHCENSYADLAENDPAALVALLPEIPRPTLLTFAAEHLGRAIDTYPPALAALHQLLEHPASIVREGALIGLGYHRGSRDAAPWPAIAEVVDDIARHDVSEAVRLVATEELGSWGL